VGRHTESDNLILLVVLLEIKRVVALMAVDNKQAMLPNSTPLCMFVKMLQPLKAKLICCLAILRDTNKPVLR
jgi:hypothetical protein